MSNSASWLFLLPRGYLVTILSEWLDIVDVGRLDSAITNHNYRLQFLDDLVAMRSTTVDGHLYDGGFMDNFHNPAIRRRWAPGSYGEGIFEDEDWKDRIKSVDQLQWLFRRRIHVEEMELTFVDPSEIGYMRFPSLRKLRIDTATGYGAVEMTVVELIKSSPALTKLTVIGYLGSSYFDDDEDRSFVGGSKKCFGMLLRSLVQHCPLLEEFTLESPFEVHVNDLLYLFRHAKALRDVSFTSRVFRDMMDNHDDGDGDDESIDDGCNVDVFADFGHLFASIILTCYSKDNFYIAAMPLKRFCKFISSCSRLKQLKYRQDKNNGKYLVHVGKSCPLIEEIKTNSWSDLALQQLSRNCKNLRSLTIEPQKYHEVPVQINPHCLELLNQIHALEVLDLPICCLSDAHIIAISSMPTLKKLTLIHGDSSEGLTGSGFESFVGSPISHSLQKIKVNVPTSIAGKLALVKALAACQTLRNVWLMDQPIYNSMLSLLRDGCPLLEKMRMQCHEVTFDGLLSFIASKTHLQRFVLLELAGPNGEQRPLGSVCKVRTCIDMILSRFPRLLIDTRYG